MDDGEAKILASDWWVKDAMIAGQGAINDVDARTLFTVAQARQAVIHTRQDVAAIFSLLCAVNTQLSSANRLLASFRFILIVLTLITFVTIVRHW
jgi:hypothetical protein